MVSRPSGVLIGANLLLAGALGVLWLSRPAGAGAGSNISGGMGVLGSAALAQGAGGGTGAGGGGGTGSAGGSAPAAQPAGPGDGNPARRTRGQYLVVSGRVQGSPLSAVYVVDTVNHELLTLRWSRADQRLEIIGHRSMIQDMAARPGRGR